MISKLFSGSCCCVEPAAAPQQIVHSSTDENTGLPHLLRGGSKDPKDLKMPRKPDVGDLKQEDPIPGTQVTAPKVVQAKVDTSVGVASETDSKPVDATQPEIATRATNSTADRRAENRREIAQTQVDPLREEGDQKQTGVSNGPREAPGRLPRPDGAPMTARTEHLEAMVAEFVSRAVRGCDCIYYNENNGRRTPVTYKISEDLELITIEAKKRGLYSRFSRKCPTVAVRDIDYFESAGSTLKPKAVASLTADDTERLLMIFYGYGKLQHITLLMESRESRDLFANGLKTLAASLRE